MLSRSVCFSCALVLLEMVFYKHLYKDAWLKDFHNVEKLIHSWMICTKLNDLYFVEWFVLRWMICTTRWMVCTLLNDLYYVEWFVLC